MAKATATNGTQIRIDVHAWDGDVPEDRTDEWAQWVSDVQQATNAAHVTLVNQYPTADTFNQTVIALAALGQSTVDGVQRSCAEAIKCVRLAQASVDVVRPDAAIDAAQRLSSDANNMLYYGPGGSGANSSYGPRYFAESFARIQAACVGGAA